MNSHESIAAAYRTEVLSLARAVVHEPVIAPGLVIGVPLHHCIVVHGKTDHGMHTYFAVILNQTKRILILITVDQVGGDIYRFNPYTGNILLLVKPAKIRRGYICTRTAYNPQHRHGDLQSLRTYVRRGKLARNTDWSPCNNPREIDLLAVRLPVA